MIINTALTADLAIAADKAETQLGDDQTVVPSTLLPIVKTLSPHHVLVGGIGRTARTSFFTFFEKLRAASTGASADVIVTLARGLWTINWSLQSKFEANPVPAVAPVKFLIAMEGDTQNIGVGYAEPTPVYAQGVFRALLKESADLRLDIAATGVADSIVAMVCIQAEKNI